MNAMITNISKDEFDGYEYSRRLFTHDYARRYARLDCLDSEYSAVFSWRSDLIEPNVIVDVDNKVVWIGVDDRLASVASNGQVLFSIAFISQLLAIELKGDNLIAICELQAMVIGKDSSIHRVFDFPDIASDFTATDNVLLISFVDGSAAKLSI